MNHSKLRRRSRIHIFAGALSLVLGLTSVWRLADDRSGLSIERLLLGDEPRVPVLAIRPQGESSRTAAILVHMYGGTKEMLKPLAVELAHGGVAGYLVDQPGHGESTDRFNANLIKSRAALRTVYEYVVSRHPNAQIVLVGHSVGGRLSGEFGAREPGVCAVVSISGTPFPGVAAGRPRSLLLFAAQFDPPGIRKWATDAFELSSKPAEVVLPATAGVCDGDVGAETVTIPYMDHTLMAFHPAVIRQTTEWLANGLQTEIATPDHWGSKLGWLATAHLSLLTLFFVVIGGTAGRIFVRVNRTPGSDHTWQWGSLAGIGLIYGAAIALSLLMLSFWVPFAFIGVDTADYLTSSLFLTGLATYFVLSAGTTQVRILHEKLLARQTFLALVAFLFVYLSFAYLGVQEYYNYRLSTASVAGMLWMFPAVLIFFVSQDLSLKRLGVDGGSLSGFAVSVAGCLLWLSSLGLAYQALHLPHAPSFLMIAFPYLAMLICVAALLSTYLARITGGSWASVLFQSLLYCWIFAAVFPRHGR